MAQTTGIINGTDLLLYVNGVAVAHASSHSLSMGMNTLDASTKSSAGWKDLKPGQRSWNISGEHLYAFDAAFGATGLMAIFTARSLVTVKFATTNNLNKRFTGSGYLTSLDLNAPNEENSTFSFSIEGTGVLTEATGS